MTVTDFTYLLDEVGLRQQWVQAYLFGEDAQMRFNHPHLEAAVYSYIRAGGKSLRPAVLLFACGAVGGDEHTAIPAAAAVELYHTFTLVHDDIIDRDETRRGVPTIHTAFAQRGAADLKLDPDTAAHYGLAIAILAGDMQQGWAASLLPDLHRLHGLPAELALNLVSELFRKTQATLINGETLDILQAETPPQDLTEDDVLSMLWQKTGVLYEFAGRAGAAIGLRTADLADEKVQAMAAFAGKCGTAFQIQDDILGILGDPDHIGKPVGSDIREGKRTVIVLHSLAQMAEKERDIVLTTLGNRTATDAQVQQVTHLLLEAGGVERARSLANQYVAEALTYLEVLPETPQKALLRAWASYITERMV